MQQNYKRQSVCPFFNFWDDDATRSIDPVRPQKGRSNPFDKFWSTKLRNRRFQNVHHFTRNISSPQTFIITEMSQQIGKQYKKDQERVWKGARMALERSQERVLKGAKTGFKRYKERNLAKFENLERGRKALRPLSTSFQPFFSPFHIFFHPFS